MRGKPKERRIRRFEPKPVSTKLRKDTHKKLREIKEAFGVDRADFIRQCVEYGVENPAQIIKAHSPTADHA